MDIGNETDSQKVRRLSQRIDYLTAYQLSIPKPLSGESAILFKEAADELSRIIPERDRLKKNLQSLSRFFK